MQKVMFVPINRKRIEKFRSNISNKLTYLPYKNGPNALYDTLFKLINTAFKCIFTSKTVNSKSSLDFNEWATVGINKSRRRLYELYSERTYNRNNSFAAYVSTYSKIFKKVRHVAKAIHIKIKL